MNKESNLSEQDIKDVNYVIEVLDRNINSMEKIEEKRNEIMAAQTKLLDYKSKIISRLEHLEKYSLTYIAGAGGLGFAAGGAGGLIAVFTNGIFGAAGKLSIVGCCIHPVIGVSVAALGIALLGLIGAYLATKHFKNKWKNSKEETEKQDSIFNKLNVEMNDVANLLNDLFAKKESVKNYTIQQLKDCLINETQRRENFCVCDELLEENKALIQLITKLIEPRVTHK